MTYSSDFRRKVLSVREKEGLTIAEVAVRFCVGVASVVRWLKTPESAVIVMDNATFHKRQGTQNMIRKAGHILLYLPSYSSDLNPIEQKWAQAKALRKRIHFSIEEIFILNQFI